MLVPVNHVNSKLPWNSLIELEEQHRPRGKSTSELMQKLMKNKNNRHGMRNLLRGLMRCHTSFYLLQSSLAEPYQAVSQ